MSSQDCAQDLADDLADDLTAGAVTPPSGFAGPSTTGWAPSDYLISPGLPRLPAATDATVTLWLKPIDVGGMLVQLPFAVYWGVFVPASSNDSWVIGYAGGAVLYAQNAALGSGDGTAALSPEGSWVHVATVLSGTLATLYLDGVDVGSFVFDASTRVDVPGQLSIGLDIGGGYLMDAATEVADVCLYPFAFSPVQVLAQSQAQAPAVAGYTSYFPLGPGAARIDDLGSLGVPLVQVGSALADGSGGFPVP
jgi:hypothetical protein